MLTIRMPMAVTLSIRSLTGKRSTRQSRAPTVLEKTGERMSKVAKGNPRQERKRRPVKETARAAALLPKAATPVIPIQKGQQAAAKLRPDFPDISDDVTALCVLHVTTRMSIGAIADEIGMDRGWAYRLLARDETQAFLARLAMTTLGVTAAQSIQTLSQLRDTSESERMRYDAAVELMDRAGLGNTNTQRAQGTGQAYAFTFGAKPETPAS
jgi:hypothetical protein